MGWFDRLRGTLMRSTIDDTLDEEMRFHLESRTDEYVRQGLSIEDARREARRRFGSVTLAKERARDADIFRWVDDLEQDARLAVHAFLRNPGFTTVAVLTLALGIGATTAMFSVVDAVLLRPLSYPEPTQLVRIHRDAPRLDVSRGTDARPFGIGLSELMTLRARAETLSHVGVHMPISMTLVSHDAALRLDGTQLSPAVLQMLGAPPLLGRMFEPSEEVPGSDAVVILSHAAWQQHFGGDANVVGQRLVLDGRTFVVIGVMDREFQFPDANTQFWIPFVPATSGPAGQRRFIPIARVKTGVPLEASRVEVRAILERVASNDPFPPSVPRSPHDSNSRPDGAVSAIRLVALQDQLVAPVRPALWMLSVAVGAVLLIACVNVASLLLARTAARRREIAVRLALGCGRGRLIRQGLTESMLLALVGGLAGTALAWGGVRLLRTLGESLSRRDLGPMVDFPRLGEIGIDGVVLVFALAVSVGSALLCGLAPALGLKHSTHGDLLRGGGSTRGFGTEQGRGLQRVLVVGEIALALILLVSAGLLMHSFVRILRVAPGFDPSHLLTFQLGVPQGRYPATQFSLFKESVVARLRTVPGVGAAGYAQSLPMIRTSGFIPLRTIPGAADQPPPPPPGPPGSTLPPDRPSLRVVSKDFLTAMGVRILAGRGFSDEDRSDHPRVMLINQALARSGVLGDHALGTRLYAFGNTSWEIVGIVDDVRQVDLAQEPDPQVFIDYRQLPDRQPPYFVVRTDAEPTSVVPTIRTAVRQLDPIATIDNIATMEQLLSNSIARRRLYTVLLGVFASVALFLAVVGLSGVISYWVTQRTSEIGIRMALGAQQGHVLQLVLSQSARLTGLGLVAGVTAAAVLTRYLQAMLFGLSPLDPMTFAVISLLFAAVAMVAAYVPARRATKVDPLVALRQD